MGPPCGVTSLDNVPIEAFEWYGLDPGTGFGFEEVGPCYVQEFHYGDDGDIHVVRDRPSGLHHLVFGGMLKAWKAKQKK